MSNWGRELRNFLYEVANDRKEERPEYFHPGSKHINATVIAKEMGITDERLSRTLADKHQITDSFWDAVETWSGVKSRSELFARLTRASEAPPGVWKRK